MGRDGLLIQIRTEMQDQLPEILSMKVLGGDHDETQLWQRSRRKEPEQRCLTVPIF